VAAVRKTVIAPAWPFCHECERSRQRLRRAGLIVLGLMALSFIAGIVQLGPPHNYASAAAIMLAVLLGLAAIIVYGRANWVIASRARVSGDGQWVPVAGCAEFEQAALGIQQSAAQQAAYPQRTW